MVCLILLATLIVILDSFPMPRWYWVLSTAANILITFLFTIEYILRVWTAPLLYPDKSPAKARLRYIVSPMAIIDLLSILPFYLFLFTDIDLAALRTLRLLRLFVFFKFNRYFHTLDTIGQVIKTKRRELITSMVAVFSLMLISSALIYTIEGQVQPDKFQNILSGLWWAVSTLLTIGYGDIYPITALGKLLASFVAILGVGLIAVPTGIIGAGFVEVTKDRQEKQAEKILQAEKEGLIDPSARLLGASIVQEALQQEEQALLEKKEVPTSLGKNEDRTKGRQKNRPSRHNLSASRYEKKRADKNLNRK